MVIIDYNNFISMENFHELLLNRRSIRKYTDEKVAPEDVKLILEPELRLLWLWWLT